MVGAAETDEGRSWRKSSINLRRALTLFFPEFIVFLEGPQRRQANVQFRATYMADTRQNHAHDLFSGLTIADGFPLVIFKLRKSQGGSPLPPVLKVSSPQTQLHCCLDGDKSRAREGPLPNAPFITSIHTSNTLPLLLPISP